MVIDFHPFAVHMGVGMNTSKIRYRGGNMFEVKRVGFPKNHHLFHIKV